jgi:MFS family permease
LPTAAETRTDPALRRLGWVLIAGLLPVWLDTTGVNVALDTLADDLGASLTSIQWVSTAYLLALAMMIPFTGWALARFGARRLWLAWLMVFLLGSVLAGASRDIASLIAFRGHASSATRIVQQIGGSFGTAVLATTLQWPAGFQGSFWWAFGFALAAMVPAALLPGRVART